MSIAVSRDTINEARDVLSRSSLRNRSPQITDEKVSHHLTFLRYRGIYLRKVKKWFEYSCDPDDEPYLKLAIEVKADYLISRDADWLDLMNWNQEAGRTFQQRFRFLKIVSPVEFLEVIEQQGK